MCLTVSPYTHYIQWRLAPASGGRIHLLSGANTGSRLSQDPAVCTYRHRDTIMGIQSDTLNNSSGGHDTMNQRLTSDNDTSASVSELLWREAWGCEGKISISAELNC